MNVSTKAAAAAAAGIFATSVAMTMSVGTAAASPKTAPLGTAQEVFDNGIITQYTVEGLQPSNDVVNVPLAGKLYEATTTVEAKQGTVTPAIPFFNARGTHGENYRVLFQAYAPEGLSPANLLQGTESTGKIYFDVTGTSPTTVAYNDAVQDRLIWTS